MIKNVFIVIGLFFCGLLCTGKAPIDIENVGNKVPSEHPLRAALMYCLGRRVVVYHGTRNAKTLDRIKREELVSYRNIAQENSLDKIKNMLDVVVTPESRDHWLHTMAYNAEKGSYDAQQIFFAPANSLIAKHANVQMLVDPQQTYVFNMMCKLRCENGLLGYDESRECLQKSRVLLADYLESVRKARILQAREPGVRVYLDPVTAQPRYAHWGDDLGDGGYVAEIPFDTDKIELQRLSYDENGYLPGYLFLLLYDDVIDMVDF